MLALSLGHMLALHLGLLTCILRIHVIETKSIIFKFKKITFKCLRN